MSSNNKIVPAQVQFSYTKTTSWNDKEPDQPLNIQQKQHNIVKEREPPSIPRDQKSYSGQYNRAVKHFNFISARKKKEMLGGLVLQFWTILILSIISLIGIVLSMWIQALMAIPILFGVIYLPISIYNWVIYSKNGSLLDDPHIIKDDHFRKFGHGISVDTIEFSDEWIHIYGDSTTYGDYLLPHMERVNQLQDMHGRTSDRIDLLFYSWIYEEKYTLFPRQSILHAFLSIVSFALGIVLPVFFQCYWNQTDSKNGQICTIR